MSVTDKLKYTTKWIAIFIVSGSMLVYGLAKPIQFSDFTNSSNLNVSEGHKVMWTFYSYSLTYPIIIGVLEIVGALLLLFNKTRILGAILLTIILSNIIIQDFIYEIVAVKSAVFYQFLVLILFLFEKDKVKQILSVLFRSTRNKKNIKLVLIALLVALIIKYLETKIL